MVGRMNGWFGLILSIVAICLGPRLCFAEEGKPTIEQILQVWKNRQDKVATARFELSCEETIHKGSTSLLERSLRRKRGLPAERELNPSRDYLVTGTSGVSLDGSKLRHSYDHQQWDPIGKKLYQEHYVDVFDGQLFKFLQIPVSGQKDYPTAAVRKNSASRSPLKFPILPLIFTFRGNHPQFFHTLKQFRITGRSTTIFGRSCLELKKESNPSDHLNRHEILYLDSKRDYIVIKELIVVDDRPDWEIGATYTPDKDVGWVPQSWEYIIRAGKEHLVVESGQSKVIHYEINPLMEGKEFDILFPPKTLVHDESSGHYVLYTIRENGEQGREIPAALAPSYEDLQKAGPRINRSVMLAVWAVIFALALIGWLWLRQRRVRNC
jgi:hypothetical protein